MRKQIFVQSIGMVDFFIKKKLGMGDLEKTWGLISTLPMHMRYLNFKIFHFFHIPIKLVVTH